MTFYTFCTISIGLVLVGSSLAEVVHQDSRCYCVCPDPSVARDLLENPQFDGRRTIYKNSSVTPNECDCQHVVLGQVNLTSAQADSFCPRCLCKYQTRNLTVIKVVVILVVWVILLLLFYMAFLSILEPILSKNRGIGLPSGVRSQNVGYSEHHDADDVAGPEFDSTQMSTYRGAEGVFNRIGTQQTKWKRQVQEQRRNIYDRHSMLN